MGAGTGAQDGRGRGAQGTTLTLAAFTPCLPLLLTSVCTELPCQPRGFPRAATAKRHRPGSLEQ